MLLHTRRDGEDVGVEDDVLGAVACLLGQQPEGPHADVDLALNRVRLTGFVEGHHDRGSTVLAHLARLLQERLLAFLEADRVADALALQALQARLQHRPLGRVDHDRDAGDLGLGSNEIEEADHRRLGVEEVGVHVHIQQVGPAADLVERDLDGAREVARLDEALEPSRPGDVRALADGDEPALGRDLERLEPAETCSRNSLWDLAGGDGLQRRPDLPDVLGSGAAAAAGGVQEPTLRELPQQPAGRARPLVESSHRVRQAGIGIAGHIQGRHPREGGDVGPHLGGAKRAVDAGGERLGVLHRSPPRLLRLA